MKPLRGRKSLGGSSAKAATRFDDNLFGTDTVEIILGVSEGPCKGIVGGASGFLAADVPLVDPGTTVANISNFELRILKGTTPADTILPNLGGTGSSKAVGLELRTQNQQLVIAGTKPNIDYLDVRFTINQLLLTDDKGNEVATDLDLYIEYKPRSSSAWSTAFNNTPSPTYDPSTNSAYYRPGSPTPGSFINAGYHESYISTTAPDVGPAYPGAMWFDSSTQYRTPKILSAAKAWVVPANLASSVSGLFTVWTWTDLDGLPRSGFYDNGGQNRSPAAELVRNNDYLITTASSQEVYSWNGVNWGVGGSQFVTPVPEAPGVLNIHGATRSPYPREIRLSVPRINEPYDLRITRLAGTSTKYYFARVSVESIQEITRDVYQFPGLALAHLTIKATDTFTSIPEFSQEWEGREIRVPTNYDPVAKTYSGFWDGTFKIAYTDNPSWIAYDLVMNTRYGKNAYYPEVMDPMAAYNFGKHCDKHGFTMNEYITDPRGISEAINYIVGTAGGRYVDRGDGYSTILYDADDQVAVAQFSPENIIDGIFSYDFTDITSRKNSFTVSYIQPLINWKEDRIRVFDQGSIDAQGFNPEEFIAVGCIDQEEAVKRARLRLATALTERSIVSFKTNRQGLYVQPFQMILIADPLAADESIITGRIASVTNSTTLALRDQVYLENGVPLSITFTVGDGVGGFTAQSYDLAPSPRGLTKTLVLATGLTITLPEKAVFSIGTPKPYRITSIEESDTIDVVSITAIEVNRLKWPFVDGTVELSDILASQTGPLSRYTYPATGLNVSGVLNSDGTISVTLSWIASQSLVGGYRIYQSYNGGQSNGLGDVGTTQIRISNILNGEYIFTVVALSADGTTESAPAAIRFNLAGPTEVVPFRPVLAISNLRLVGEPRSPIFDATNPTWTWDPSTDTLLDHYFVEILDTTNSSVIYSTNIDKAITSFVFPFSLNKSLAGGPRRNLTIRIRAVDTRNNSSDALSMPVTHPAPSIAVPSLSALNSSIVISYPTPPEIDAQGALFWISTQQGFTPNLNSPTLDTFDKFLIVPATKDLTYYVRMAVYDSYGKTGLNLSAEYSIKVTLDLFDATAPSIPGTPQLTTTAEIAADGTATAAINATWAASTGNFNGSYAVAVSESGSSGFVEFLVKDLASFERHGFRPNISVQVKVRALSKEGFAPSGYSPVATITTAKSLTVPANPTAVSAVATYQGTTILWTAPAAKDIAYYELWSFDGTSAAATPASGATLRKIVAPSSVAWDNNVAILGTRTYWLRSVSTSDIPAAAYTNPVTATNPAITGAALAAGIIDATKVAAGLEIPGVVDTLPVVAGYTGPGLVRLNTDGKLYRLVSGAWTKATDGADIVANSITAGQIAAFAIGAGQISASAITTDKLAVGLNTGNLLQNSDFLAGAYNVLPGFISTSGSVRGIAPLGDGNAPGGMAAAYVLNGGNPTSGGDDIAFGFVQADGTVNYNFTALQPGRRYEFSCYLNTYRSAGADLGVAVYDVNSTLIRDFHSTRINGVSLGALNSWPRAGIFVTMPATAYRAVFYVRTYYAAGTSNPYTFLSGAYLGFAGPNQTVFSDWVPASQTVINGGQVATNSLNANKIVAGSITTERMTAGTINADRLVINSITTDRLATNVLTANNIQVGNGSLTSLIAGTNTTTIDGGALSANSVTANRLKIGSRGISISGLEFQYPRDAAGNYTGFLTWTAGGISYIGDNGTPTQVSISAGSAQFTGAGNLFVWWDYVASPTALLSTNGNYASIIGNSNNTMMAVSSGVGVISLIYGATIIDGTKITTLSIDTAQLRAGAITAGKIAANAVTAGTIAADAVVASSIAAGAITAKHISISDNSNMLLNGDFGGIGPASSETWSLSAGSAIDTTGAGDQGGVHRLVGTGRIPAYGNTYAVSPGDVLYFSCMNSSTGGKTCSLYVEFYDRNFGGAQGVVLLYNSVQNSWVRMEAQYTVPAGKEMVRIVPLADPDTNSSATYWGKFQMRRASGGTLIVDGSISALKLSIGISSANLVPNSDCQGGSFNYNAGFTNHDNFTFNSSITDATAAAFAPKGMGAVQCQTQNTQVGRVIDVRALNIGPVNGGQQNFPVVAGQRYEFSAYVSCHRCQTRAFIMFCDINGGYISEVAGAYSPYDFEAQGALSNYTRPFLIATAPAGTASAFCYIRGEPTVNGTTAYVFASGFYFAQALQGQSQPSAYSAGSNTVIDGGFIRTNSITASQIAAGTITANSAIIQDLAVGNIKIAGGAVSQVIAQSSTSSIAQVSLVNRSPSSKYQITGFFRGDSAENRITQTASGRHYLEYSTDGTNWGSIDNIINVIGYLYNPSVSASYKLFLPTILVLTWAPAYTAGGTLYFRARNDNGGGIGGVFISVTELAK